MSFDFLGGFLIDILRKGRRDFGFFVESGRRGRKHDRKSGGIRSGGTDGHAGIPRGKSSQKRRECREAVVADAGLPPHLANETGTLHGINMNLSEMKKDAEQSLEIRFTTEEWEALQRTAGRAQQETDEFVRATIRDQVNGGELIRARQLLEEAFDSLRGMVEESENLSGLDDRDKELFLSAIEGVGWGVQMFLPKRLAELRRSPKG